MYGEPEVGERGALPEGEVLGGWEECWCGDPVEGGGVVEGVVWG